MAVELPMRTAASASITACGVSVPGPVVLVLLVVVLLVLLVAPASVVLVLDVLLVVVLLVVVVWVVVVTDAGRVMSTPKPAASTTTWSVQFIFVLVALLSVPLRSVRRDPNAIGDSADSR